MTLTNLDPQKTQKKANQLAQSITRALRLPESDQSHIHNLVWWDPGFRLSGVLPKEEQSLINISYASAHGVGVLELKTLRKTNFPVTREGLLCDKVPLDAPADEFLADTLQRREKVANRPQKDEMSR